MSGHSKFANIKHKKEKNDAKRGKIFTVIGREIAVAVKEGGPDPNNNSKLRDVVAKAKANNMPNDTIERGIKKAAGNVDAVNYVSCQYEGYGPNGTAIIVEALTDNKNRTASNVRNAFTKGNGNVGTTGCVSYMFDQKGQILVDKEAYDEPVYDSHYVCKVCGYDAGKDGDAIGDHTVITGHSYHVTKVQVGTKHHDAVTHQETKTGTVTPTYDETVVVKQAYDETVTTGYKCSCGAVK